MKSIYTSLTIVFLFIGANVLIAQKIGINTTSPLSQIDICQPAGLVLSSENKVVDIRYNGSNNAHVIALSATSQPQPGAGVGAQFTGGNTAARFFSDRRGALIDVNAESGTVANGIECTVTKNGASATGIKSIVDGNIGGHSFALSGAISGLGTRNVGVYGSAMGGTENFAGYFDEGHVYVNNNLGIGELLPDSDIDIVSSQAVLQVESNNYTNGSSIELRNSTPSPFILGTINFGTENTTPGRIAYYADHELVFRVNSSDRFRINANGLAGFGRVPVTNRLEVEGSASKSTAGDWVANSDARLKKNIQPLDAGDMIEKLLAMKGVTYEWNDDKTGSARPEGIQYGFTAQNIQEVFPTLVEEDNNGYLQTAYGTYDAMMVEAIRYLYEENRMLKEEMAEVKAVVARR